MGEPEMAKERILLVEDNSMNRRVAEFLLKAQGYVVYEAQDGQEALELAKLHVPDLVLMDLQLPGLDGFAATRMMKQDAATKDIPVVALTAYAMRGDAERALDAGCDGYITKPIDPEAFPNTVASYLKPTGEKIGERLILKSDPSAGEPPTGVVASIDEAQHIRKARLETIGDIASVLGHETRNLLGALRTCVEVLLKNPQITRDDAELLDIIQTGSERLAEVLAQFAVFQRTGPTRLEKVNLHELIEKILDGLQRDERCSPSVLIRRQFDPSVSDVVADPHRMEQLFWQLFLNAYQALGDQGQIEVDTEIVGREIRISVHDTGPGIPQVVLPKIFDPLYTTKSKGAGLGLTIVQRIAEEHQGRITVHSESGTGTCFTVTLPIEPKGGSRPVLVGNEIR